MRLKLLVFAVWACSWIALPSQLAAQNTISCASQNNDRQYCAADTRGGVTLVRQNSQSSCIQNQSWGYDGRGIWVDRGCRADFRIGNYNGGGPGGPGGDTITCESKHNKRNYCRISNSNSNVELVQQLGQSPCTRGSSWGNDGQGIWVDRGCRATFRVSSYGGDGPGWWNSGPGHRPSNQPKNGACFFREANFSSDYFCIARGSSVSAVQSGFNDQISSIKLYGGASVTVFNDANFRSTSISFRHSINDLRGVRLQGSDNKTWNNRISSIQVN